MKQILGILGSNFLGHITNMFPILEFFQNHGFHIKVIVLPLSTVSNPPIIQFLEEKNIEYLHVDKFEHKTNSIKKIFSYYDLLYQFGFHNVTKLELYYQFINNYLDTHDLSLVLSDFTFFTGHLCNQKNIPFAAIRSHALKTSYYNDQEIELFNWWDTIPQENADMIDSMKKSLIMVGNLNNATEAFYSDITITPGFKPYDDIFPSFTEHYFVVNSKTPKHLLPIKDAYIYIRDQHILTQVIDLLEFNNKSYWIVDSTLNNNFIDLWESTPKTSIVISHGGHGLCLWAIYNQIFHFVIPDNNDRLSNAKRVKNLGFGTYMGKDDFLKNKKYCFNQSEYNYKIANSIKKSHSFQNLSKILYNKVLTNEKK